MYFQLRTWCKNFSTQQVISSGVQVNLLNAGKANVGCVRHFDVIKYKNFTHQTTGIHSLKSDDSQKMHFFLRKYEICKTQQ